MTPKQSLSLEEFLAETENELIDWRDGNGLACMDPRKLGATQFILLALCRELKAQRDFYHNGCIDMHSMKQIERNQDTNKLLKIINGSGE